MLERIVVEDDGVVSVNILCLHESADELCSLDLLFSGFVGPEPLQKFSLESWDTLDKAIRGS